MSMVDATMPMMRYSKRETCFRKKDTNVPFCENPTCP
jgi:hypothetical protein